MADGGITSLLQFIPAFMQLMHGMNNSGQKQTAAQLRNVNNAMVNPDNPLYQQMYGQYQQQGKTQLGENISQMEGQNRMLSNMGRTPLFAPGREGEAAFRAQAALGPQIGVQAGQQTQAALANAAKGLYYSGGKGGVNEQLMGSQYGPTAGGAANQSMIGLTQLGNFLNQGRGQQQPSSQQLWQGTGVQPPLPWQVQNSGINAPGAQQGGSLLSMLFGGQ